MFGFQKYGEFLNDVLNSTLNTLVHAPYMWVYFSDVAILGGRIRAREPPLALRMEILHCG